MFEFYLIYPNKTGDWSFSLIPTILLDYDNLEGTKNLEVIWLFWGFGITRHFA
jgi:hypothetical protein